MYEIFVLVNNFKTNRPLLATRICCKDGKFVLEDYHAPINEKSLCVSSVHSGSYYDCVYIREELLADEVKEFGMLLLHNNKNLGWTEDLIEHAKELFESGYITEHDLECIVKKYSEKAYGDNNHK